MIARKKTRKDKFGNTPKRNLFILSLLFIPLLNFCVFTIYANFGGIFLSFKQFRGGRELWVAFENYQRFFRDFSNKGYGQSILVSLCYLPIVGGISLPLSTMISFFLYKKIPCSKLIVVLLYIPNILPVAVMSEFYRRMWDAGGGLVQTGALNKFFSLFTGREQNWLTIREKANYAVWIYTVWFGFGFNALLLWGAMTRIPQEVIEAATLDGCSLMREFFSVDIPIIWPTLSMVIVLTMTTPFQVYMQPLVLANNGDYGTRTWALLITQEIKRPDTYFAAALSIMGAFVSVPTLLIVKKLTDKCFETVEV